jgi:hypothetical protein
MGKRFIIRVRLAILADEQGIKGGTGKRWKKEEVSSILKPMMQTSQNDSLQYENHIVIGTDDDMYAGETKP